MDRSLVLVAAGAALCGAGAALLYRRSSTTSAPNPSKNLVFHGLGPEGRDTIKLEYFDIFGVGEKVRLALALNGAKWEDVRLTRNQWKERKPTARYGQLPMMTLCDGREIYQSDAMLRYAGAMGNGSLYPTDPEKRLEIDEAIGLLSDLTRSWRPCLAVGFTPQNFGHPDDLTDESKSAILKKMRETWIAIELPKYMGYVQGLIERSGGPFLCGSNLCIADLQAAHQIKYFTLGYADHVSKDCLNQFPVIESYITAVLEEPTVAAYYSGLKKKV